MKHRTLRLVFLAAVMLLAGCHSKNAGNKLYNPSQVAFSARCNPILDNQLYPSLILAVSGQQGSDTKSLPADCSTLQVSVTAPTDNCVLRVVLDSSVINYVIKNEEFVSTTDTPNPRLLQEIAAQGASEAICVPMIGRYGLVGVLYVDIVGPAEESGGVPQAEKTEPALPPSEETRIPEEGAPRPPMPKTERYLTREHIKLMFAIAHQVAMALEDTQYYSAMLQAERLAAVGQTVAVLSHHIKNILQGIEGGSYLIQKGLSADDKQMVQKGWGIVEKNQGRVSDLILDMLSFSKERQPSSSPLLRRTKTSPSSWASTTMSTIRRP